jgi:fructose 1,6-bisphosphate aldolase/phosphatase
MGKITLSVIKADIGSIGGHIKPSQAVIDAVAEHIRSNGPAIGIIDFYVGYTGDDIAILMSHRLGLQRSDNSVHRLAWDAFMAGTIVAKRQGLYAFGQDLLKDAFSGNIRGLGPAVAEMEIDERPNESFILFAADKTDPGAYSLPLYLAFADPMYSSGLLLSPGLQKGFDFHILDVNYAHCPKCDRFHFTDQRCNEVEAENPAGDRVITLSAPDGLYKIAALIRDTERYIIESIYARDNGLQAVAVSTTRLHNIAGKYTGKDDPVMLVRVQSSFPATGEVLAPFAIGHYVAGFMRGSHNGPLMPVKMNSPISFFDGPPIVSGLAFSVHDGEFTEPADVFDQPFWDEIRSQVSRKAVEIRRQGFFGPAMLPMSELEYGGIVHILKELDSSFQIR